MSSLIGSLMLWPAERLLNGLIGTDPHIREQFARFSGRCLYIHTSKPELHITAQFSEAGISLGGIAPETTGLKADATIRGEALELLQLLRMDPQKRALANPSIRMDGDLHFIQDLYGTLHRLDLDLQDVLQPLVGDVLSDGLGKLQGQSRDFLRDTRSRMQRSIEDYLKEELRAAPPRPQREDFQNDLQALRLGLDRLEARLARLRSRLDDSSEADQANAPS